MGGTEKTPKITVMVVDDSAVFRGFWSKIVSSAPDMEVVTTAIDGRDALTALSTRTVDIILLDVEMGEMDGLTALPLLLQKSPSTRIIMASALTTEGSKVTVKALLQGASDFIAKPSSLGERSAVDDVGAELLRKIRALKKVQPADKSGLSQSLKKDSYVRTMPEAIMVGSSTGGPNALVTLLGGLGTSIEQPILIVQHMPAYFISALAERLTKEGGRPCIEARPGMAVLPGRTYIAPGDFHMRVSRRVGGVCLDLDQSPPENYCRPAVDPLFRSAAEVYGHSTFGIVLTGMGEDGKIGSEFLTRAGALVYVQDEASSVVWGMPGAVARAGLASAILPINEMAERVRAVCEGRA